MHGGRSQPSTVQSPDQSALGCRGVFSQPDESPASDTESMPWRSTRASWIPGLPELGPLGGARLAAWRCVTPVKLACAGFSLPPLDFGDPARQGRDAGRLGWTRASASSDPPPVIAGPLALAEALRGELQAARERVAWLESRLEEMLCALFGAECRRWLHALPCAIRRTSRYALVASR